ncbi:MAG TPA: hypothetical protein VGB72_09735 [Acidobacteriota bacterium]
MNWGFIGLLAVFGIFIILLIINPNLSCFGRRIKSPFYPLIRRSKEKKRPAAGNKAQDKPSEDYGFKLD